MWKGWRADNVKAGGRQRRLLCHAPLHQPYRYPAASLSAHNGIIVLTRSVYAFFSLSGKFPFGVLKALVIYVTTRCKLFIAISITGRMEWSRSSPGCGLAASLYCWLPSPRWWIGGGDVLFLKGKQRTSMAVS